MGREGREGREGAGRAGALDAVAIAIAIPNPNPILIPIPHPGNAASVLKANVTGNPKAAKDKTIDEKEKAKLLSLESQQKTIKVSGAGSLLPGFLLLPLASSCFLLLPLASSCSWCLLLVRRRSTHTLQYTSAVSCCLPLSPTVSQCLQPV